MIVDVIPPQEAILPTQICVLCGVGKSTKKGDHLPPQCIYPAPRKPNLELHKVPACAICNNAGAKHDEEFKVVLSLLTGEYRDNPDAIISSLGKTIDFNNRLANQFFSTQERGYVNRGKGLLEPVVKFTFSGESYSFVIQRIVRGMYWRETGMIMPKDAQVTPLPIHLLDLSAAEHIRNYLFSVSPKSLNDNTFVYRVFLAMADIVCGDFSSSAGTLCSPLQRLETAIQRPTPTKRWDNNRLHTEHSAGVLPEIACLSCPVSLERYSAQHSHEDPMDTETLIKRLESKDRRYQCHAAISAPLEDENYSILPLVIDKAQEVDVNHPSNDLDSSNFVGLTARAAAKLIRRRNYSSGDPLHIRAKDWILKLNYCTDMNIAGHSVDALGDL